MDEEAHFVDFYRVLEIHPACDYRDMEISYRNLAKKYHPDHPETANSEKFNEVLMAYRSLRNPEDRARYDEKYASRTGFIFSSISDVGDGVKEALSDAEAHAIMLSLLYKKRRESARDPGLGQYMLQRELKCSDENFDFYVWYLTEKGFIKITEQGTMAITIEGVDHVIATSRTTAQEILRIARTNEPNDRT